MARKKAPPEGYVEGTSDNLTPEQQERAWLLYYFDALRKQSVLVDRTKAAFDAEKASMTDIFRAAKADAKFPRKLLQQYLDDAQLTSNVLSAEEETRVRHKTWLGQPVGSQLDLFNGMPVEVQDEAHAKGVGYAMGLRGEACELPDTLQPRFAQHFSEGWGKGQEELSWALVAVGKIVDRRPDANANPVQLDPEPDDETVDIEDAVEARELETAD